MPTTPNPTSWIAVPDADFCFRVEGENLGVVFEAIDMCKSALMLPVNDNVLTFCLLYYKVKLLTE